MKHIPVEFNNRFYLCQFDSTLSATKAHAVVSVPLLVNEYWIFSFLLQLFVLLSSSSALFSGTSWSSRTAGSPGNVQLPKRSKHIHTMANTQWLFHHPLCFIYLCAHRPSLLPPSLKTVFPIPPRPHCKMAVGVRLLQNVLLMKHVFSYTQLFTS